MANKTEAAILPVDGVLRLVLFTRTALPNDYEFTSLLVIAPSKEAL